MAKSRKKPRPPLKPTEPPRSVEDYVPTVGCLWCGTDEFWQSLLPYQAGVVRCLKCWPQARDWPDGRIIRSKNGPVELTRIPHADTSGLLLQRPPKKEEWWRRKKREGKAAPVDPKALMRRPGTGPRPTPKPATRIPNPLARRPAAPAPPVAPELPPAGAPAGRTGWDWAARQAGASAP